MKIRILDRIIAAIAGLILIACCAGIAAQVFFNIDIAGYVNSVLARGSDKARAVMIGGGIVLLILGLYCLTILFRHKTRNDKFITQKNEDGDLTISLKALENMVNKCVEQHQEIHVQNIHLENLKDGVVVIIRGSVSGGISIPLTVESLQKQIKQYVTSCSGIEVKGIRVQIESSGEDAENAPFAIGAPNPQPLLYNGERNEKKPEAAAENEADPAVTENEAAGPAGISVPETPPVATVSVPDVIVPPEEYEEQEDDRPLHQRLFSMQEEPCIVPAPPEIEKTPVSDENDSFDAEAEKDTEVGFKTIENADDDLLPEKSISVDPPLDDSTAEDDDIRLKPDEGKGISFKEVDDE